MTDNMARLEDLDQFYILLLKLEKILNGKRRLNNCTGKMNWPKKGVYFFFEPQEMRADGITSRVVRVGTHALKVKSKSTVWNRLRQHRGNLKGSMSGGGNHRGSVFRLHVGTAIIQRQHLVKEYSSWGVGSSANKDVREKEYPIEKLVSEYIGKKPFLWLSILDEAGPNSMRGYIERNSIALLSNYGKINTDEAIDPPSKDWLGFDAVSEKIRASGLWNSNHVSEDYSPEFLIRLEDYIDGLGE